MSFLKPKPSKSTSDNVNNGLITQTYTPAMQQGVGAQNFMAQLLGLAPGGAGQQGYATYLNQAGYAPAMRQLSQGITGQGAAAGLLNSGATARALQSRGAELNQQFFNNYLQQLSGLSGMGLQSGNLIANTGQRSVSTGGGPSTFGAIGSAVGGLASIFSDRRLKENIYKVDELPDGLGVYQFNYKGSPERYEGVMADEVANLRPWALGPEIDGYATVDYGAL